MSLSWDKIVKRYMGEGIKIGNLCKVFEIEIEEDTRIVDFRKEENGIIGKRVCNEIY